MKLPNGDAKVLKDGWDGNDKLPNSDGNLMKEGWDGKI